MNPDGASPWSIPLWQVFSICTLIVSILLGLLFRGLRVEKEKRHEMLRQLHKDGEIEVIRSELGLFDIMNEFSVVIMIRELMRAGIIHEQTRKEVRANRWEA